ncbi:MAG: DUF853 family protein, partial [Desulfovibrionaceae bacterium]|nr:DUF853 family protein [Desulfovibrionaceae bacterium]
MLDNRSQPLVAMSENRPLCLVPGMGNRHGLITGATGTGKTVTLQTLAESFSALGVPVFLADIKGDLSGLAKKGMPTGKVAARIDELGLRSMGYVNQAFPVTFWDVFGQAGQPLRTTVSDMGPLLLSRMLDLNEVQSALLHLVFRVADDNCLLLLDMKDLRSMLQHVGDERELYKTAYGQISTASIGAIQRALLRLEEEGGDRFFGEPALDIGDMLLLDGLGRGRINILAAEPLMNAPRLYSCLLLWLLSELFENLPEVGDTDKPRLVFFFDEAHLLFDDAPDALVEKIEQVTRLIRSRGVGVYFVSQNPADMPDTVLGQLGNRIQHALRAFTPREQKAVRAAAQAFRSNPAFTTGEVIGQLAVGEALVSFLDEGGAPHMVERALIIPPQSQVGPLSAPEREAVLQASSTAGKYTQSLDRESAYEHLMARARMLQQAEAAVAQKQAEARAEKVRLKEQARQEREARRQQKAQAENDILGNILGSVAKQTRRTITNTIGREIGK